MPRYPVHIGGMWFGASRAGCMHLLKVLEDSDFVGRFRHYFCAGEMLFNTAVAISGLPHGPGNHAISQYVGARPQWIGVEDFDALEASGKFFARKFPDQPDAPARLRMLERIGATPVPALKEAREEGAGPAPAAEPGDAVPAGARLIADAPPSLSEVLSDAPAVVRSLRDAQGTLLEAGAPHELPGGDATHPTPVAR